MGESRILLRAVKDNLPDALDFVCGQLRDANCPELTQMHIEMAVEEVFVNIALYAYAPDTGDVDICVEIAGDPAQASITFTDKGKPFDPLEKEAPDITLPARKRKIGGLGIFTVRHFMDDVQYERVGDSNVLTIRKSLAT